MFNDRKFKIYSIVDKQTASYTERHYRRKGHEVNISWLEPGACMVYDYEDGSGWLRTSTVQSYTEDMNHLIVQTLNTVYAFEKVVD